MLSRTALAVVLCAMPTIAEAQAGEPPAQAAPPAAVAPSNTPVPAATPAAEQATSPAIFVPVAPPAPVECCVLSKLTPVFLTIDEPLDSDKSKIGQRFKLSLSHPLQLAGGLIVPAGTQAVGEVVHAAKSRAMGKAGELVLAARYLDYQGAHIPLRSLRYGKGQGKDNAETAAIVGMVVSAWITPFITGGEVRIPAGTDVWAKTASDVSFPRAAQPPTAVPIDVSTQVPAQGVK